MSSSTSLKAPPTKRAAKVKRAVTAEKSAKTVWTADMVSTLLDRRCDDFAASFELHRSAAQLSVLWGKIALAVNVQHGTNISALAAKNKYSSLKREYSAIRMAEKETGNAPPVVYPMYWDCLVSALGSKESEPRSIVQLCNTKVASITIAIFFADLNSKGFLNNRNLFFHKPKHCSTTIRVRE
ncbi:hypothetical protein H310_02484 [Aphanomyces invadans]|uniref:Myb/SANT-like domain-containing protein n=1 Tax=Aphanomyces invadans TaxID=157072 RepID=A0A024UPB0_9STRA|nr:hypothetical protein H310_02484 [Aphanomyces invadans]ETW08144.1 hypothetical protein H310_02484 [Aphanomyces invadans]|eukprot:XP_008864237.1 hypothetical protein H310_02484 [Aphanomyces invadans]